MTEMTEDKWIETFKPLPNPVDNGCGYDFGQGCTLVETYSPHTEYLDTIEANRIWTVVEGDEGHQYIMSGKSFVNRIGYIVTENPWEEDISVDLDEDMDEDESAEDQAQADADKVEAYRRFDNGEKPSYSTFIDEVTITAGYGNLDSAGMFQYPLAVDQETLAILPMN